MRLHPTRHMAQRLGYVTWCGKDASRVRTVTEWVSVDCAACLKLRPVQ